MVRKLPKIVLLGFLIQLPEQKPEIQGEDELRYENRNEQHPHEQQQQRRNNEMKTIMYSYLQRFNTHTSMNFSPTHPPYPVTFPTCTIPVFGFPAQFPSIHILPTSLNISLNSSLCSSMNFSSSFPTASASPHTKVSVRGRFIAS